MAALIDDDLILFGGKGDWETDPMFTPDPAGYDSVKATLCFKGSGLELNALYALGAQNAPGGYSAKPLFYTGPKVTDARFGYQIAEMEWKGMAADPWTSPPAQFVNGSAYVRSMNITMSTVESQWPREANGNTLYLPPPYAPPTTVAGKPGLRIFTALAPNGSLLTTAELPWRVRLIGRAWAVSLSGIIAGPRAAIIRPPRCIVANPVATGSPGVQQVNWLATNDPLVSWSDETQATDGWVCRNYEIAGELPLGPITLARWTANYEWVLRYGP